MRKTKVSYEGGMIGAQRRLGMASKQYMVTPFTPDEAQAYLAFLTRIKQELVAGRRQIERVVQDSFPTAQYAWDTPDKETWQLVSSMASYLKSRSNDQPGSYTPEEARALLSYTHELREQGSALLEMRRGIL